MTKAIFVRLDVSYFDQSAFTEISDAAELLFVRGICRSAQLGTDGYLTTTQVERISPQWDDVLPSDLASELVQVGLWIKEKRGYRAKHWADYHFSLGLHVYKQGGELGNHQRWHANRGLVSPKCPFCAPLIASDIATDSLAISLAIDPPPTAQTQIRTSLEPPTLKVERRSSRRGSRIPEDFALTEHLRSYPVAQEALRKGADLEAQFERFRDFHTAKGTIHQDWNAAWRYWIGGFKGYPTPRPPADDRYRSLVGDIQASYEEEA